jgi:hypothetical protein
MAFTRDPNSDLQLPPLRIDGWEKGIDNLRKGFDIGEGFLRDAVNVDISNTGKIKRRAGATSYITGSQCHSLYSYGQFMCYVDNGNLKVYNANKTLLSTTPVNPINTFSYETVNGDTYCTNKINTYKILPNGTVQPWGIDSPAFQPLLTRYAGNMFAGTYQVAITYVLASGEESGTGKARTLTVPEGSSIVLTGFPNPPANVAKVRIYVSNPDGGELYLYNEYGRTVDSAQLSTSPLGPQLRTQFMGKIPAGSDVAYSQGRLFVADGNAVYFTQPLRYGLYNNVSDFLLFPSTVKLIWGAFDGLYVATETETYFVVGAGTDAQEQKLVLPTGAIPGTKARMPDKVGEMWMTPKGIVRAYAGGQIDNISYDKVSIGEYESGAAIIREDDGLRRFVSSVKIPKVGTQFATMDFFDAEVVKP